MKISVCMMVKDEADKLTRCLMSARRLADEIVVVDTGSSDATPEIAERFGAVVKYSPWRDDFSFHRNESLEMATGDWVLILDADEELELAHELAIIRKQLAKVPADVNAMAVHVWDMRPKHKEDHEFFINLDAMEKVSQIVSPRFFRRGKVHYRGIVHNQPIIENEVMGLLNDVRIKHYGYGLHPEAMQKKYNRTTALLKRQIEEKLDNWEQAHFYLAEQLGSQNDWLGCLEQCREYVRHAEVLGGNLNGTVYNLAAGASRHLGLVEDEHQWILAGLARYPLEPDLGWRLAEWGDAQNDAYTIQEGSRVHIEGVRSLQAQPHLAGNRFHFSMNPECYTLSLFRHAVVSLKRGLDSYKELQERFNDQARWKIDFVLKSTLKDLLKQNFEAWGLSINEPTLPPAGSIVAQLASGTMPPAQPMSSAQ